ncbi:unnamed protein product [Adineta steineri]|uniref:phosphatidylinositol 3-kinase n=1 Tax=Adineta steineri TaxID=433720 RepID=A0A814BEQ3_9BILA|nr:unnamed protein product [Adineta steineri]CAF1137832.1 unnamed protein product [Adineta steineri]
MSSSNCVLPNLPNNRHPAVPRLNLPSTSNDLPRSESITTTPNFPSASTSPYQINPYHPDMFSFPRRFSTNSVGSLLPLQRQIRLDTPQVFNTIENISNEMNRRPSNANIDSTDLIDMRSIDELSILDTFDPLMQPIQSPVSPPIVSPDIPIPSPTTLFPYPIKLRLKLTACSEMKPFSQLVERIRNECQSKQSSIDEIVYCKRVKRLTSQHIERNQLFVTIHIFTDGSKEPVRLPKVYLQVTVASIMSQLHEIQPFDYEQSIFKLRSYEEYLCNDDALCDIEYVYNCINSLKPLQILLVKKPIITYEKKHDQISFEQFYLNQHEKYFQTIKQTKFTKTSNKNKQSKSSDQVRLFDSHWIEEFRQNINTKFEQIEQCINHLINPNLPLLSIDEQIKSIQELINYIKTIQITCSDIQSPLIIDKQRELKTYINELIRKSSNGTERQALVRLLFDSLLAIIKYIETYCQAFLIPYEVEIYNNEHQSIDIEQLKSLLSITVSNPRSIEESSELFSVHIDSLFSLPSNVKTVRISARLCYGNQTRSKQMTRLMSFVRNASQENSPQIHFDQRLTFDRAYLCGLQREALILFEIYASFFDETDSSLSPLVYLFDGLPMRLIGWCSQTIFDHEHRLINGERYLGIIDATTTNRTGFYSLRNVSDRDCPILTISFDNQAFCSPNIQPRNDIQAKSFTEINQDKQASLCRLLDRPSLLLVDHSAIIINESSVENRKQQSSTNILDEDREFSDDECHFLWSHRHFMIHKPYALPKLLKSRSVWDYPSLIDIYALLNEINHHRIVDEIESFELLLPTFPDMYVRSFAYRSLISRINSQDLMIYLPQLLQIIKFDYNYSSPIIEYLLQQCINDYSLAHKLYWYLRQLFLTENIHFIRYYYIFISLLYVMNEQFHAELQNEYDLCVNLKRIGDEIKSSKLNRRYYLVEQLKELNNEFFQSGKRICRLPCQFNFKTNDIDIHSCSIFTSLTSPIKLVFNSIETFGENYQAIYKIGDDLRQDQAVLQLLSCMDKIWQSNDFDFRLSLFNVVQTQECCGFVEMITDSETLLEIEKPLGAIKGSFSESALYDWLRKYNTIERDFQIAVDNLTYSCAGYCVATYILGIGDRHNENIMVKKSGHLFHIDFGKYLGDNQKFGWFNRDRTPFIFTKQMLYAMSDGGTSNDAMHRFIDLCCNAFHTLRQNSSLLLLLLSHLCSSNVPKLNSDAVLFVYDRLAPTLNYAESITHFTNLIVDSLNSTWPKWNGFLHKMNQPLSSSNSIPNSPLSPCIISTYTIAVDGKIQSAQVVKYEKRTQPSKHYLYKLKVERINTTYHYRTYNEIYEFYERLIKQFPLIGLQLKYSRVTEDRIIVKRHASDINEFFENLFRLTSDITESDLVCSFFYLTQRDQQINEVKEKSNDELSPRSPHDLSTNNQSKIGIQLKYDSGKLFIMVRHASNLPLVNGNEPRPYCKCYLNPDETKATKQKGKIHSSRDPVFNDTFTYEMDLAEIQNRVLRVGVWNHILNISNHVLGEVDIVLSEIDWSKEHACNYTLSSPNV